MFPLLLERWYSETLRMALDEKGAYLELMLYLFYERRPIKDAVHVARILRIDPRTSKRLWPKLSENFVRNQHGYSHELVTKILNNKGRIKGLSMVADSGGASSQEKELELDKTPQSPPVGSRMQEGSQSSPRRSRSAGKILRVPHVSDQSELDKFAKEHGIPIKQYTTYQDLYSACCRFARDFNHRLRSQES